MKALSVYYVDDEEENLRALQRLLRGSCELRIQSDPKLALEELRENPADVLISDQRMPGMAGVDLLARASSDRSARLGMLLTAFADMEVLVDAVNRGLIFRYLSKPIREFDLRHALDEASEKLRLLDENESLLRRLEQTNEYLREEIRENHADSLLENPPAGLALACSVARKVSATASTVLLRGESGVGKEVFARAIHEASPRAKMPFIRVNCGALTESLLESELFGHEKGAFTGSIGRKIGKFEAADGGTLFLDEIGDVSAKLQVNLLRALQEKEFERVGGNETLKVDVRVIAATHQPLESMIEEKRFREDLFFRLNVFPIHIPPLRERIADLPQLTEALLIRIHRRLGIATKTLTKDALEKLKGYDWPGNVRELENVLERALILAPTGAIGAEDIVLDALDASASSDAASELTIESIRAALEAAKGNKVEAARRLGVKRPTLYYHLKRLGLG